MENIEEKCQLISDVFNLPIFFYHTDDVIFFEHKKELLYNPLQAFQRNPMHPSEVLTKDLTFPRIRKTKLFEKFILISVYRNQKFLGTIVAGPCLSGKLSEERIYLLIKEFQAFSIIEDVTKHYQKLPIYGVDQLTKIGILLQYLFNDTKSDESGIKNEYFNSFLIEDQNKRNAPAINIPYSNSIHDRKFENEILKIVKNGEIDQLSKSTHYKDEEDAAIYSKSSHLRSLKNHLITLVALVSRAAVEGGLHSEIALEMSDRYILKMEESYSADELYRISGEMLYYFTTKVRESKNQQYSLPIVNAIRYIVSHITEPFNQDDIAAYTGVSPNYLSTLFNKETGNNMSIFIQKVRVEEAQYYLDNTSFSISEIGELLHFTDQSYFTKVFKKHTGLTPNQYRNKSGSVNDS